MINDVSIPSSGWYARRLLNKHATGIATSDMEMGNFVMWVTGKVGVKDSGIDKFMKVIK